MVRRVFGVLLLFGLVQPGLPGESRLRAQSGPAPDWTQWRGPSRDGTVPGASTPDAWPERLMRKWHVPVGEGYASPVLAASRVYVHSRRDPVEVVTAIDVVGGDVIWQQEYAAPYEKNSYATAMAKGPNATPLVADGRVFTLGATAVLSAWEVSTGRELWRRDFSDAVDFSQLFCGTAASPLMAHGLLVVQVGSDVHGGTIAGIDPETGETRWEWQGAGPGYASPAVIDVEGVSQIVTLTNESVIGLDARTGRPLWATPFANAWHENIATPVWTGTRLVASNKEQGTVAYQLVESDGAWRAEEVWRNQAASFYMSSPVVSGGTLFGFSDKRRGSLVAIDLATGETAWQTEGREGAQAGLLLAGSHLLVLTDEARLIVANPDPTRFAPVHEYSLDGGPTWAQPVVTHSGLLVRTGNDLSWFGPGN